jgi:bis(5'-nucleosyl)-tetraphosphatase (symmetrical)
MEFSVSDGPDAAPPGFLPWFDVPGRQSTGVCVAFGHWSTMGWLDRTDVLSLDTGCVWGGCLSALKLAQDQHEPTRELIQVSCPQAQQPGA